MSGWKARALSLESGEKVKLKNLPGYWIVPKKLSTTTYEKISDLQGKMAFDENKNPVIDSNFRELVSCVLMHGIHEHNLDDEEGNKIKITEDVAQEISEHFELAMEIFSIIMEFSRPLPKGSDEKSETAPNGSTAEMNSESEKSSLTEVSPPSS